MCSAYGVNQCNLHHQHESVSPPTLIVKLALQNIRSLLNKSFSINYLIATYNILFLFLTEPWLDQATSVMTLIESAPPNFTFMIATRTDKKGYCHTFQRICSHEVFSAYFVLFTKHLATIWLDELSELLLVICLDHDCFIKSGDLNLHEIIQKTVMLRTWMHYLIPSN